MASPFSQTLWRRERGGLPEVFPATFRFLFVLIVLLHHCRGVVHVNVAEHPTARWTTEQIIQAFLNGTESRYLLQDRYRIYG